MDKIEQMMCQTFRAQIEFARHYLSTLTRELESTSTEMERVRLTALYDEVLKDTELLELQLASLEQREQEKIGRWAQGLPTHE